MEDVTVLNISCKNLYIFGVCQCQCGILLILNFIMPWEITKTLANAKPWQLRCQAEIDSKPSARLRGNKNCL